ncbi:MAG: hypothetical protein LBC80_04125 [Treponema sp.]|jgi:hypothetical protein|nr:hypothetical protein [Treponema sp.]
MTITQTVNIQADRRVRFDFEVPLEIPEGKAQVEFKVIPFAKKEDKTADNGKIRLTKETLEEMVKNSPTLHKLTGILHTDMTIEEIRMARLSKHL